MIHHPRHHQPTRIPNSSYCSVRQNDVSKRREKILNNKKEEETNLNQKAEEEKN